jgi:hypothetical protein
MSIHSFHQEHILVFDFPYALIHSSEALSPRDYITILELEHASWHSFYWVTSQVYLAMTQRLKLCELGRNSLQTNSLGDFELTPKSLTKNLTKRVDYSPRVIRRST